jgi:Immunoglobulin I-set domain
MDFRALGVLVLALSTIQPDLLAERPPPPEEDTPSDSPLPGLGLYSASTVISAPFGTSFQVNVSAAGQNIAGDAANEPSICIDPNNLNRIAIGWRQFDNTNSNFRQSGVAFSTNGGLSWTFPGNLEAGVFRSDPVLASDVNGTFYYLGISNANTFNEDLLRSTNGGATWQRIGDALGGDKEWMAIDTTSGPGRGNIYQAWQIVNSFGNSANFMFTRSTNGGANWMTPIGIPHAAHFGTLDIGPNGEVYVLGWDGSSQFWLSRSTNASNRSVTPSFDLTVPVNLGGALLFGGINSAGLLGQAWVVVDRSTNTTRGNIYALCSTTGSSNTCDVMFSRSTNRGASWSAPVRINDLGPNSYHWFGAIAVAPNGRIDVCWYDTRSNPNNQFSELYYSYSLDGGLTWAANRAVSSPFDPSLGYPQQNKLGDYIGVVALNDATLVAYSATFNGEEDIYFLRMPDLPIRLTVAKSGANAALSWNAVVGNTYCLQYKSSISAPWPSGTNQICLVATNAQMMITDALLGGPAERYYRVVLSAYGPGAPSILAQPASVTNYVSLAATFSVTASGTPPLSYQWSINGTNIPGATQAALTLRPIAQSDAGSYSVRVTNIDGFVDSASAVLTVLSSPSSPPSIPGLVVHLPFDNDLLDATGRGNSGTAIQSTATSSNVASATFVSGVVGSGLHYFSDFGAYPCCTTNNANYVTLGVRPDLQFGANSNFTVAYWIRLPSGYAGGDLPFFTDAVNSTFNGGFCFAPSYGASGTTGAGSVNGGWALSLFDGATGANGIGVYGSAGSINDGNWHHLVHTIDRVNGMVTYLDGVAAHYTVASGSSLVAAGNIDTGRPATIGQDPTGKYTESGSADMDDLGVWRRALTALEASSIYMAGMSNHVSFTGPP